MRILIAEDNPTDRVLLTKLLERHGECTVVDSGNEAISAFDAALADNQSFRLICLDIMLPDCDGKEVLETIRRTEQERDLPPSDRSVIIMTTGKTDMKTVLQATSMGCDGYVAKPIDKDRLFSELAKLNLIKSW